MAQAQELTSIKLLVEDAERRNNNTSGTTTHDVERVTEAQDARADSNAPDGENTTKVKDAPEKDSKKRKPRRGKNETKNESKGITSKSPAVRLLDEEKRLIKKLEAHILLETGETVADHQLIMDAVREYTKKHYPDFQ